MKLFSATENMTAEEIKSAASASYYDTNNVMLFVGKRTLDELFPELQPDMTMHYVSRGEFSNYELVFHLLQLIGPAEVMFTTYSLKEYPVRLLLDGFGKGLITSIKAILDSRIKSRTPEVMQLVESNFASIRMAECHAKVCVLRNPDWTITITGSSNWTNNKRIEHGEVFTQKHVGEFHVKWMEEVLNEAQELK